MFKKEGMSRGNAGATERVPEGTAGTSGVDPATRRWTAARKLDGCSHVCTSRTIA
jgi:hypothetical protein